MRSPGLRKLMAGGALVLLINTSYVWAFASPTIFYMGNVLLHVVLGTAVTAGFLVLWRGRVPKLAAWALIVSLALGLFLTWAGATTPNGWALWAHILAGALALGAFAPFLAKHAAPGYARVFRLCLVLLVALPLSARLYERLFPDPAHRIVNSRPAPLSMEGEGGGPDSPFFPSSARTNTGGLIPASFFLDSETCGECHKDIYDQWRSSMHHFASFNNQFYRKSIEYMQEVVGTRPSRWCAGCHDHAMLFSGRFDQPAAQQIDTREAQAGLGCVSCHAITHVDSTMGNGGFTIAYPPLHELASSRNKYLRALDQFLTYLDPEPHRRTFMKPFMREQPAEFCSACHKVHLDVPVNSYRWVRGFNDYDNWQAGGVSGQGARSFYYPAASMNCSTCHMPLVPSRDPGNVNGMVHSHRFAAANTAVPHANRDAEQLRAAETFLKSGFITVDIFAAAPAEETPPAPMWRRHGEAPQLSSTFAVGEEAEQIGRVFLRDPGEVAAPLNRADLVLRPGTTVRLDVVVRTRSIGHFFPAGTVDAFDVWLELKGEDAAGRVVFWSGAVEDGGRGPVEPGAHFYRAFLLDGMGNPINKRNAWMARSTLYVRLIPPGAADCAHYRVKIPESARGAIRFTAKLNYRKFSRYYTEFAYAGKPGAGSFAANHDSREFTFHRAAIPKNVSGKIQGEIPDLPIVTLAGAEAVLQTGDRSTETEWRPVVRKEDRERWNDWGIGLLLQGDLKGAGFAFKKVTEAEPEYADGWLNVARALIQEGETEAAKPYIARALAINPTLARIHFFKAMIEKAEGDYDAAIASLRGVEKNFPRDRVVLNQLGRLLFLKRQYAEAVAVLERTLKVDPEDLQAHYNLMLCYRGLGDIERARRAEALFKRFKADEAAQEITAKPRMLSPEDNNERQIIHEHVSIPLGGRL